MLKTLSKTFRSKKGFTLIELLVVIAIIGVLASIVLASLNNARQKSRDARRISDIKQIQLALELYFDGTGAGGYPVANATACSPTTAMYGLEALAPTYIPVVPTDPNATLKCYKYSTVTGSTKPTTYHLGATLEDTTNSILTSQSDREGVNTTATDINGFDGADPIYNVTP